MLMEEMEWKTQNKVENMTASDMRKVSFIEGVVGDRVNWKWRASVANHKQLEEKTTAKEKKKKRYFN